MTTEFDNDNSLDQLATEVPEITQQQSLRDHVAEAMQQYFHDLDGQDTKEVYNLVMAEVEPPLLKAAMKYTRNNQSKTAALLGLNRGTLRKKLKQYNLL
ncbi:DNA-binding transcriptional regulator Fis [Porticoccaceae bacterium]|jgi:Fis family transcriptional regulator|nr:DNA-binding transcriptional regulator Fis [Porticoccaceae bacterium]MDA9014168.1 DNA-binding transcriptional regulator Fis [Porticoccaceae bacterium]